MVVIFLIVLIGPYPFESKNLFLFYLFISKNPTSPFWNPVATIISSFEYYIAMHVIAIFYLDLYISSV